MEILSLLPELSSSYSQGIRVTGASRLLFVSGQVPETPDGEVPDGFEAQCRLAWQNVRAVLEAGEMTLENLVKVTIFLSDRRYRAANAKIRHEVLGDIRPALTIIITGIYDEAWLLEIEGLAVDAGSDGGPEVRPRNRRRLNGES